MTASNTSKKKYFILLILKIYSSERNSFNQSSQIWTEKKMKNLCQINQQEEKKIFTCK